MANEKKHKSKLDILAIICIVASWVTVGVIFALFVISELFHTTTSFEKGFIKTLDSTWTYTTGSGLSGECTFPENIKVKFGDSVDISTVLPDDIKDGPYLLWRTSRNHKLYIASRI